MAPEIRGHICPGFKDLQHHLGFELWIFSGKFPQTSCSFSLWTEEPIGSSWTPRLFQFSKLKMLNIKLSTLEVSNRPILRGGWVSDTYHVSAQGLKEALGSGIGWSFSCGGQWLDPPVSYIPWDAYTLYIWSMNFSTWKCGEHIYASFILLLKKHIWCFLF